MIEDGPVTKRDLDLTKRELQEALTETKRELQQEVAETKRELRQELTETKLELHQAIHQAAKEVTDSVTELIRDTETKMLTAFHGYARGNAARFQRTEISEAANAARIEALESRVPELETRQGR